MQRWEYCQILILKGYATLRVLYPDKITTTKIFREVDKGDEDDIDAAIRMIAALGRQGWEIAGIMWREREAVRDIFLKRPIQSEG